MKEWMLQRLKEIERAAAKLEEMGILLTEVALIHANVFAVLEEVERDLKEQRREGQKMLQGVDQEMEAQIAKGRTVLEAQVIALVKRQSQYEVLSPEWKWFQSRIWGAFQEVQMLKHQEKKELDQLALLPEMREKLGTCCPPLTIKPGQEHEWEIVQWHIQSMCTPEPPAGEEDQAR